MKRSNKDTLLQKRRWRIRKKIKGTAERPRLAVHFSNKNIYAQCIDDVSGHTLVQVSSIGTVDVKANKDGAIQLGKSIAEKAVAAGIDTVVFDRSGRLYHGCVKSFAEAAREGGLKF